MANVEKSIYRNSAISYHACNALRSAFWSCCSTNQWIYCAPIDVTPFAAWRRSRQPDGVRVGVSLFAMNQGLYSSTNYSL